MKPLRKALLLATPMITMTLLAMAPTASAGTSCTFDTYAFHATYDCEALGVGGDGTLHWCPDQFSCVHAPLVGCYFDLTPPWYCW